MDRLNRLRAEIGMTPTDAEIFDKMGAEITDAKQEYQESLELYIQGLVSMAMKDLNYTDTDIDHVVNEVMDNLKNDEPADVVMYAMTHDYTR